MTVIVFFFFFKGVGQECQQKNIVIKFCCHYLNLFVINYKRNGILIIHDFISYTILKFYNVLRYYYKYEKIVVLYNIIAYSGFVIPKSNVFLYIPYEHTCEFLSILLKRYEIDMADIVKINIK